MIDIERAASGRPFCACLGDEISFLARAKRTELLVHRAVKSSEEQ
ncbi:hypothetical protein [uncultured Cohaesibacter sp.]|nr:hypothetical protein [uncultured Cohaesibacter sp.]